MGGGTEIPIIPIIPIIPGLVYAKAARESNTAAPPGIVKRNLNMSGRISYQNCKTVTYRGLKTKFFCRELQRLTLAFLP